MKSLLSMLLAMFFVANMSAQVSAQKETHWLPPEIDNSRSSPFEPIYKVSAEGVQIYECRARKDDPANFEWVLKAPEAELFDLEGKKVGRLYAGPTWELTSGDKVIGKVKFEYPEADGKNISILSLTAISATGATLSKTKIITRNNTAGGVEPKELPKADLVGQVRRVPYTAIYRFYER